MSAGGVGAITTFLNQGATIEVLHLDVYSGKEVIEWAQNAVPLVKEFSGPPAAAYQILHASCETPRPLESIRSVELNEFFWAKVIPKIDASRLRKLEVASFETIDDVLQLAREFPCLVSLFVNGSVLSWSSAGEPPRQITKVRASHIV